MTFTIEQAKALVTHYKSLIGTQFDDELRDKKVTDIVIVPTDPKQYAVCMDVFHSTDDNEQALLRSGYDPSNVKVLVLDFDRWGGGILFKELDAHLTRMGIKKIYPESDLSGNQNQ